MDKSPLRNLPILVLMLACSFYILVYWLGAPQVQQTPIDIQGPSTLLGRLDSMTTDKEKEDIFFMGSSTVLGHSLRKQGVKDWPEKTISSYLQKSLGAAFRVANLGFDGALHSDMLSLSRRLSEAKKNPDKVIIATNLRLFAQVKGTPKWTREWMREVRLTPEGLFENDINFSPRGLQKFLEFESYNLYKPLRYQESLQLVLFGESPRSYLKDLATSIVSGKAETSSATAGNMILQLKQKAKYAAISVSEDQFQVKSLTELIQYWEKQGVKVFVYHTQDNPETLKDLAEVGKYKRDLLALKSVVTQAGAEFIPTNDLLSEKHFIDTTHLMPEGNKKLAHWISQYVKKEDSQRGGAEALDIQKDNSVVGEAKKVLQGFEFGSISFWFLLFILFICVRLVKSEAVKHLIYFLFSVFWLMSYPWSIGNSVLFLIFLSVGYLASYSFTKKEENSPKVLILLLIVETILFVLLNKYAWSTEAWIKAFPSSELLRVIGISYMYFKIVHLLVDSFSGDIKEIRMAQYLTFILGFLTLLAGPVMKYKDYVQYWGEGSSKNKFSHLDSLLRIALGMFKKMVLAHFFYELSYQNMNLEFATTTQVLAYFYFFAIYVYCDFSGYTDMAIGAGQLVGFKFPENFNWPFLSRGPSIIWKRWHMSFTEWLETYLFNPVMKQLTKITKGKRPLLVFSLSFFFVFFLAGAWHGTLTIVLWGLVTAFVIVLLKIIDHYLKKFMGKKSFKALKANKVFIVLSHLTTFHFICYSFSLIGLKAEQLGDYHRRLFEILF
jgi:D-alanyl-lipoteichoic acid acyltransferase DltB (MBOAT superfamily)